jgi:colanic acid/amylovoran biosynthesis glycosyltransferase
MQNASRSELVILPSLAAVKRGDAVLLTRKFVEGLERYAALWNGPVRCLLRASDSASDNLDNIEVKPNMLPFALEVVEHEAQSLRRCGPRAAVIVGSTGYTQNHVSGLGRQLGVPVVYICEYSLRTRLQVVHAEVDNPLRVVKRSLWELRQESRQRRAIRLAQGIQCNGTPTYDAYRGLTPNPLLYFDTRATRAMTATEDTLAKRLQRSLSGARLRLAFSGRLVAMKGAEHLVRVAAALKARKLDFELNIYGAGSSEPAMRREIARLGLESEVNLAGTLDFGGELMPRLREHTDLLVCCHRQGDPACTYIETLACGVPIVGYANEAWLGLLRRVNAGAAVPLNDTQALADCIARVAADRGCLREWSYAALRFAREHCFEQTFASRVEHFRAVADAHERRTQKYWRWATA